MEDAVAEEIKSVRLARLQSALNRQQIAFNETFVSATVPVLLDRRGRAPAQLAGRSPWMQAVHVDFGNAGAADAAFGETVKVKIVSAYPNSLAATPTGDAEISTQEAATV